MSALCLGQRLAGLDLADKLLHRFVPVGADPAPVLHQHKPAELTLLDHEAVELRHALPQVAPVQHKVIFDWGALVVLHVTRSY